MAVSLGYLNAADRATFLTVIGPIFERSPWIAAELVDRRPFATVDALDEALRAALLALSDEQKLALVRAHPDLAGRAAIAGELTAESAREQASAGLDRLTPEEFARFTRLNDAYQTRFGIPFIICVREHTRQSILAAFEARLARTREQEIGTAIDEIVRIGRLRLLDVVADAR